MKKIAFVTDFDGTITCRDFFFIVTDYYCDEEGLRPWKEYLAGKKTHLQTMKDIFCNIKGNPDEFLSLMKKVQIDEYFVPVMEVCKQKGMPVYIVSAGCDYYIRNIIGEDLFDKYGITLISNSCTYSEKDGLNIVPLPKDSPYYSGDVGVDKAAVVRDLHNMGYEVIFAGDGRPDFVAAEIADVVFAKDLLKEECEKHGIKTEPFAGYNDILNYMQSM